MHILRKSQTSPWKAFDEKGRTWVGNYISSFYQSAITVISAATKFRWQIQVPVSLAQPERLAMLSAGF